ncbi:unnamed protein product [Prorocentrum cordatum]|uniref:Uncharacterized protein n=1 Tax=Prorocentrum cordatum TaxID=2364126 RepID=A0ABN9QKD5_9DINO|nr:unnamed protein product [Polarella glacialis]
MSSTQGMRYLIWTACYIVMSNASRVHPDLDSSGKRPDSLETGSSAQTADLPGPAALLGLRVRGGLGLRRLLGLRTSQGSEVWASVVVLLVFCFCCCCCAATQRFEEDRAGRLRTGALGSSTARGTKDSGQSVGSSAVHPERAPLTPSMSSGERAGGTALFGRCSSSTPSSMLSGVGITGLPLAERSQGSSSEQPRQQGALARCKTATSKIADISMSITGKDGSFDWAAKQKDDIQPAVSGEEAQGKLHSNFLVIEKMVAAWEVQERAAESKDDLVSLRSSSVSSLLVPPSRHLSATYA